MLLPVISRRTTWQISWSSGTNDLSVTSSRSPGAKEVSPGTQAGKWRQELVHQWGVFLAGMFLMSCSVSFCRLCIHSSGMTPSVMDWSSPISHYLRKCPTILSPDQFYEDMKFPSLRWLRLASSWQEMFSTLSDFQPLPRLWIASQIFIYMCVYTYTHIYKYIHTYTHLCL